MDTLKLLLRNFFTHKDFLPPPDQLPGTLFTPLQMLFCAAVAVYISFAAVRCSRKSEAHQKKVFFLLWLIMVVTEPLIIIWEVYSGAAIQVDWTTALSLWPCSIFLYAAPFAIWGKGTFRQAACGYICTLGLGGGAVNFVYPATYLSCYSCISLAGFRTVFYHGAMVFTAVTMLLSGYHSYRGTTKWQQLLLPAIPGLLVSIPANIANFTIPGADYMFFKLESFFLAPIGRATPDWFTVIVVYLLYLTVPSIPYLPSYFQHRKSEAARERALYEA